MVRRLLWLIALTSWISLGMGTAALRAQPTVHFAQITDVHLVDSPYKSIDSQGKPKDDHASNRRALDWAIREINRRSLQNPYDFVVFTGDAGLEALEGIAKGGQTFTVPLPTAVSEFADAIESSSVKRWLFIPGNNDVKGEDPTNHHIDKYREFVDALGASVQPKGYTIVDLAPRQSPLQSDVKTYAPIFKKGDCLFVGLDNSSFKGDVVKDQPSTRSAVADAQYQCIQRVIENIELQKTDATFVYIFCHIPYLSDPSKPGSAWDESLLGERSASSGPSAKEAWQNLIQNGSQVGQDKARSWQVKGIFAGHFHTPDRWQYDNLFWCSIRGEGFEKLRVCPPLAAKFQVTESEQARGFRDVRVYGKTGEFTSEIVWFDNGKDVPGASPVHHPATLPTSRPCKPSAECEPSAWIVVALIVLGVAAIACVARLISLKRDLRDIERRVRLVGLQIETRGEPPSSSPL